MTDREKAIVMAYTGICMLKGEKMDVFYQYLYELYNRPVYTHELLTLNIKEQSKSDFLRLCKEEEPKRKTGKWIDDKVAFHRVCSECGAVINQDINQVYLLECMEPVSALNYCPNCGARMEK